MSARLVEIYIAPSAGASVQRVPTAQALEGRGLDGDRYAAGAGSFNRWPGKGRALSLVSAEALRLAESEFDVRVSAGEHRRNLVVEGVDLRALLGQTFRIGEALFRGVRICAPCTYLVRNTGQEDIFDALVGRGGLRAEIIQSGRIAEGDALVPVGEARPRRLPG